MLMGNNSGSGLISARISARDDGYSLDIGGETCYSVSDIAIGMVNIGKFDKHHINIAQNYSGYGTKIGDFFNL